MSLTTVRPGEPPFRDRADAGAQLVLALPPVLPDIDSRDVVVLGLVRGGVPVAAGIARTLGAPLDAFTIRKIRAPGQPELAIGAVGPLRTLRLNEALIRELRLAPATVQSLIAHANDERNRIDRMVHDDRLSISLTDKIVVLVDDGLATGASMRVAVDAASKQRPRRTIVAVPVAAREVARAFREDGVATVVVVEPERFQAVSHWYRDFAPVPIDTVRRLLADEPRLDSRASQPEER